MDYSGIKSLITYYSPIASPPSSPDPGDVWYAPDDGADGTAYCYCSVVDGGAAGWVALSTITLP